MAGISRYEKTVLLLTAGFILFTGGYFVSSQSNAAPYQVTTTQNRGANVQPAASIAQESDWPDTLLPGEVIGLNSASVYDLQRLPGIGEQRAKAIVTYREEHGAFQTVEDLMQVSGIGEGIVDQLKDYADVS